MCGWTVALSISSLFWGQQVPTQRIIEAPQLEGGSMVRIESTGKVIVQDLEGRLRWSVQLGGPIGHVAADEARVFVSSGRYLRLLSRGVSGWSLDLGQVPQDLRVVRYGLLAVRFDAGTLYVDSTRGRFCTPREPCLGLEAFEFGQVGVPFLDLAGIGIPGLGLLINPRLLDEGDFLGAYISPGIIMNRVEAVPAAPHAPQVVESISTPVFDRGHSGKVRRIHVGVPVQTGLENSVTSDVDARLSSESSQGFGAPHRVAPEPRRFAPD